ncbi:MAG: alanine dehydrogenase, partial [Clostridia bacterium]|nr:alanine dehydrogenase [Clostridia bacterium]
MIIGTTKELKNHEYRVGLTPDNSMAFVRKGHQVYVETRAGEGAGFSDEAYRAAGATILNTAAEVYEKCDMIIKVKEPEPSEYNLLRAGQLLFTYLHLAPNPQLAEALLSRGVKAVA